MATFPAVYDDAPLIIPPSECAGMCWRPAEGVEDLYPAPPAPAAPTVTITSGTTSTTTDYTLTATIVVPGTLAAVQYRLNGGPLISLPVSTSVSVDLTLREGANTIQVIATDTLAQTGSDTQGVEVLTEPEGLLPWESIVDMLPWSIRVTR